MTEANQPILIVISGAFNSGKTEFIRAVSEIEAAYTDYGRITIPEQPIVIYLFANSGNTPTSPIETLFENHFPEEVVRRCGYIVVLDGAPDPELMDYHQRESSVILSMAQERGLPFVVAVTKQDKAGAYSPDELHNRLQLPADMNILPCSAHTDPDSVRRILLELLALLPQDEIVQQAQNTVRAMIK